VQNFVENDVDGDPTLIANRQAASAECARIQAEIDQLLYKNQELESKVHQGGVGKFAAQQEINDNNQKKIPELRNLLDKAKKVEAKAQKALEEFGSELDRILQQLGLPSAD
jgi:transcription initiation factor TFIIIB Brf1 subunit/transcription initiation factor TFIIB